MPSDKKVCIIGAGCSGITAIKNLIQAGVKEVVCFEQNDRIGGNWVYTTNESHSSVCETTHLISSKTLSEFLDFPMPEDYPDYPSHRQVLNYFESYCEYFGLFPFIRFQTRVLSVQPGDNQQWKITTDQQINEIFDFVLIANGHHSVPRHPDHREQFTGRYLHSHDFKNTKGFENKKVLVLGAGNSACDCAVEISRVAESVDISFRTPQFIFPKFFMGQPIDVLNSSFGMLPGFLQSFLQKISLRFMVGDYKKYGLENPKHPITSAHPTLNSELLYAIRHGKITPRRTIKKIEGQRVHFSDDTVNEYDVLLAATGYKISTPFLEPSILDYSGSDRIELYLRMFHPDFPTLIFVGLVQPQGAIWPLSDLQSKLVANYIMGKWKLPENIRDLAAREADSIEKEFLKRKRHSIEVHFEAYARRLRKEIPKDAPK